MGEIRVITLKHRQMKIIRRKENRQHRKYHLDRANDLRQRAESLKRVMEEHTIEMFGSISHEHRQEIDSHYNLLMSEAIAEENSKCMDGSH